MRQNPLRDFIMLATFWLFAISAAQAEPPAVEIPSSKPCRLFLLGGQSNMDGCGIAAELPEAYRHHPPNVVIWDNQRECWVRLAEDTTAIKRDHQFGPEIVFAHRLAGAFPAETIALMKTSAGGTKLFSHWLPGQGMYERFIRNYRMAAADLEKSGVPFTVGGMLWMQGESDSETLEMANAYEKNLTKMFADVRQQAGRDDLPIVMGRISSSLLKETPWNFDHAQIVQAAQDAVAAADPRVHVIPTDDLATLKDNTHFNSEAQLTLGGKMAEFMLKAIAPATTSPENPGKLPQK